MSFGITINGHTQADSKDVEAINRIVFAIAHEAVRKLKALPGATNITLSGWCNEATGGGIALKTPVDEEAAPTE